MSQELDLPELPTAPGPSPLKDLRKRRIEYDPSSSSDPPLFSSDDHEPPEDDAVLTRRKRQYRGAWWGTERASRTQRQKRTFKRAIDSGVWMGSDSSETSFDDSIGVPADPKSAEWIHNARQGSGPAPERMTPRRPAQGLGALSSLSSVQPADSGQTSTAERIIQRCCEEGNEHVDLSDLQLTALPNSTLRPLRYLTKNVNTLQPPPSQEAYTSLVPEISLFLSKNLLRRVPGEIFQLENLVVLSLRNNKLTELPPAIGRLRNLQELNIAGNKLQQLPFEFLRLWRNGRLKMLHLFPNPFVQPSDEQMKLWTDLVSTAEERELKHVMNGPITYCNIDGSRHQPVASSSQLTEGLGGPLLDPTSPPEAHHTPSLLELTLRACSRTSQLAHLPGLLPEDSPPSLPRLLHEAQAIRDFGGQECSVCGKAYVVKRVEWLEWWMLTPESVLLPLLRRGCSWRCTEATKKL